MSRLKEGPVRLSLPRFKIVTALLAVLFFSDLGFAAHQQRHSKEKHPHGVLKKNRIVVPRSYSSSPVPTFHPRGTSDYPFGPGINFPYADRPYGDPNRWGEN